MKKYDAATFDFSGKVVLVTGAASGIFQGVAQGFGEAGADVAIVDMNMAGAEETKKSIEAMGQKSEVYKCDVSNVPMVVETVEKIIKDFGKIDVLVNGAGVLFRAKCEEYPEEKWDFVLNVQAKGTFFMCREVGRHMLERGSGKIVNCSSMLAWTGGYLVPSYAAAKAAITQFTKSLCNEWSSRGVNVNAIAPGYIITDITRPIHDDPERNATIMDRLPVGRWGEPADLVGPVLFLSSEASDYIHGAILPVDGGFLSR